MKYSAALWKNSLNYGLIAGIILVIYSLILYIADLTFYKPILFGQIIGTLIAVVFMVIGTKNLREKLLQGSISYGRAFTSAFLIGMIAMAISLLFSNLLTYVIDPDLQQKALDYQAEKMLEKGRFTEEQIDAMLEQQKAFSGKWWMIAIGQFFALLFMAIISAILSLITAAFQKKDEGFSTAMADVETDTKE